MYLYKKIMRQIKLYKFLTIGYFFIAFYINTQKNFLRVPSLRENQKIYILENQQPVWQIHGKKHFFKSIICIDIMEAYLQNKIGNLVIIFIFLFFAIGI